MGKIRNFLKKRKKGLIVAGALAGLTGGTIIAESKFGSVSHAIASFRGNYTKHSGQYWQDVDEFNSFKNRLEGVIDLEIDEKHARHWAPDPEIFNIWPLTKTNEIRFELDDGTLLATKNPTREYVSLDGIPENVIMAFLLREDRYYWDDIKNRTGGHHGINWKGKLKAIFSGGHVGGSGITEQVAKMLYVTKGDVAPPRSGISGLVQKILNEEPYAAEIDRSIGKEKVLEFYLNNIYLGDGNYGILAASKDYFKKDNLDKLTLPESLFLAVLVKSPADNPKNGGFDAQFKRYRNYVESLYKQDLISEDEYNSCIAEGAVKISHDKKYVLSEVKYPDALRAVSYEFGTRGISLENYIMSRDLGFGFTVRTSIESRLQDALAQSVDAKQLLITLEKTNPNIKSIVDKKTKKGKKINPVKILKRGKINATAVMLDTHGRVVATYGGLGINSWAERNRSFQDSMPVASTIKPIIYSECVESGKCDLKDLFMDIANFSDGTPVFRRLPRNWDSEKDLDTRTMTLEDALVSSNNIITRYVYEILVRRDTRRIQPGESFEDYLHEIKRHPYNNNSFSTFLEPLSKMGFDTTPYLERKDKTGKHIGGVTDADNNVLGSRPATPLKVAAAYGAFLDRSGVLDGDNTGNYYSPSIIDYVILDHNKIDTNKEFVKVFESSTIELVRNGLSRIAEKLLGRKYQAQVYGKTGTSQNSVNVWYAGVIEFDNDTKLFPLKDTGYSFAFAVMNEAGQSIGNVYAANIVGPMVRDFVSNLSKARDTPNTNITSGASRKIIDFEKCKSYSNSYVNEILNNDVQLLPELEELASNIRICALSGQANNDEAVSLRYNEGLLEEKLYELKLGSTDIEQDVLSRHVTSAKAAYEFVINNSEPNSTYSLEARSRLENLR